MPAAVAPRRRLALTLAVALLAGLLATLIAPGRLALAAPAVRVIGTAENAGASSLTITVGVAVPAGHSIIVVVFAQNGFIAIPNPPTCSDPTNGTYALE